MVMDNRTQKPSLLFFNEMKRVTMAAFSSSKSNTRYSVRSISFPARSHPIRTRMEEALNKLRSWQGASPSSSSSSSNAETLSTALFGLAELYVCIDDLLNLPLTQQALTQHQNKKWNNELLDCSLKHLDLCSNTRDVTLSLKQIARELQSALRRSKGGDLSIESNINAYICCRKTMKKEIAKFLASLKQIDNIFKHIPQLDENHHHISEVIGLLSEASLITASIFHTLLLFLSPSVLKPKSSKWSLVSKLMRKSLTGTGEEQQNMNELERVDVAVSNLRLLLQQNSSEFFEEEKIQSALVKLESLDAIFESFEDGLECLFRRLIHTRVSLLNILSH